MTWWQSEFFGFCIYFLESTNRFSNIFRKLPRLSYTCGLLTEESPELGSFWLLQRILTDSRFHLCSCLSLWTNWPSCLLLKGTVCHRQVCVTGRLPGNSEHWKVQHSGNFSFSIALWTGQTLLKQMFGVIILSWCVLWDSTFRKVLWIKVCNQGQTMNGETVHFVCVFTSMSTWHSSMLISPLLSMSYIWKAHFNRSCGPARDVMFNAVMNSRKSSRLSPSVSNVLKTCSANYRETEVQTNSDKKKTEKFEKRGLWVQLWTKLSNGRSPLRTVCASPAGNCCE